MRERESRIGEKMEVVAKDGDDLYRCLLTDISATGISMTIGHFIPTYKQIGIVMEIAGEKVAMNGSVRWSIDPGAAWDKKGKLGIFIIDPPPEFLEYVKTREKNRG
ncbi:MAG TPA: PilZ domain-containing protein [Patescibacteria group bacterium]|nr:PilZ domain-containing protein [Patescibacteria group bacterium]